MRENSAGVSTYFYHCRCKNFSVKQLSGLILGERGGGVPAPPDPPPGSATGKGKDKIKRSALINDIENGGLKMLDLESMIFAQRIIWLKKYVENYESPWKYVLDFYLKKVGGKFLLHFNFDCRKLSISLPVFYKECLQAWSSRTNCDSITYKGIMNQII